MARGITFAYYAIMVAMQKIILCREDATSSLFAVSIPGVACDGNLTKTVIRNFTFKFRFDQESWSKKSTALDYIR